MKSTIWNLILIVEIIAGCLLIMFGGYTIGLHSCEQDTVTETAEVIKQPLATTFQVGHCYKLPNDNPFSMPVVMKVKDIKGEYMQYLYVPEQDHYGILYSSRMESEDKLWVETVCPQRGKG